METITKSVYIDSEVLKIPELRSFIGHKMDLVLFDRSDIVAKENKLQSFFYLAGKIDVNQDDVYSLREQSKI